MLEDRMFFQGRFCSAAWLICAVLALGSVAYAGPSTSKRLCAEHALEFLPEQTAYSVVGSYFRSNRDLFSLVKSAPVKLLEDLLAVSRQKTVLDLGCGIARFGQQMSFLTYRRTLRVAPNADYKDFNLPQQMIRDVGKRISSGGMFGCGRCLPPPQLGERMLEFLDGSTGKRVHIPTVYIGNTQKLVLLKRFFSRKRRPNYLGVTATLKDRPREDMDNTYYVPEGDVYLPVTPKAIDWTAKVRKEERKSGGKFQVVVGLYEELDPDLEEGAPFRIDWEGVLAYQGKNFTGVLQRSIDSAPRGGVIWYGSEQLGFESFKYRQDASRVILSPRARENDRNTISLKSWLASIDGLQVSLFPEYPNVVRIKKLRKNVVIPELILVDIDEETPPTRLFRVVRAPE